MAKKVKQVDRLIRILIPRHGGKVVFAHCPDSLRKVIDERGDRKSIQFLQGVK